MKRIRLAALSITAGGLSGVTIAESDSDRVQTHDPIVESVVADETNETAGTFTGTVTGEDGDPFSQARLRAPGKFVVNVNDDGMFEIDLEPGEYDVAVTTEDPNLYTKDTVTVEANETTRQNFTFNTSDINETTTGTFSGTITDEDGDPFSQARLRAPGEFVVTVDDDGTFENDVRPGEYEVSVITSDRRTTETVAIEANETTNRTITLETSETKTASNSTTDGNSSSDGETSDDDGLPGFGVTAGVVALLGALLIFRRS
ncbi:carboxypeptidase regulatory-like domain-containing protein [Natrinema sp. SYSU A 869]|uniref:carboxypeptidase regulatory-like domain-containing protein n=1 Tax=Natrinema sp. SYSU A 869 TaxID=2871694 RepID=UPI001CA458DE|nr:carboxypeptidase regulatory-like domain-containing protein [Natrinema sp. SYSU A 869]